MVNGMNRHVLGAMLLLTVVGVACKSKKGIISQQAQETKQTPKMPNPKEVLLAEVSNQQNKITYYNSSGSVNYRDDKTKQELGINIVMEDGKYIFMNVTALLGITVARVMATPDSLVLLDMLHRKAIIARYENLSTLIGVDLQLTQMQNIILGNSIFNHTTQCLVDTFPSGGIQLFEVITQTLRQTSTYQPSLKVKQSIVSETGKKQEFKVDYTNAYTQGNNLFPSEYTINIRAEKNMEAQFELKNFVFEKKKEIQFSIPKSYEIIRM
jgi:regulator of sigma D